MNRLQTIREHWPQREDWLKVAPLVALALTYPLAYLVAAQSTGSIVMGLTFLVLMLLLVMAFNRRVMREQDAVLDMQSKLLDDAVQIIERQERGLKDASIIIASRRPSPEVFREMQQGRVN